jgi:hypothetical protein
LTCVFSGRGCQDRGLPLTTREARLETGPAKPEF